MRIAIVNQPVDGIVPPVQNSIGIWTYETARRLSDRHRVSVHGPFMRPIRKLGIGRYHVRDGVEYTFHFLAPQRLWSRVQRAWDRLFGQRCPSYSCSWYYVDYLVQVAVRLRRLKPDVIHIHNCTSFVPLIRVLNPRARIVLHMSCEWLSQLDRRRMAKRMAKVDAVFGSSDHITDLVRRRFPEFADRCTTVYNGVDLAAFVLPSPMSDVARGGAPMLVFVGRVSPEKGVHDLLDALAILASRHPTARLDVLGWVGALPRSYIVDVSDDPLVRGLAEFYDRDYGEQLRERVDATGLGDRVRFLGAVPHDEVVHHVAAADVLVNPSYSESFGMSLVEAFACGTPVVATRVGGMPEIVGDDAGILVDRCDPVGLAAAIGRLLDDAELRTTMAKAGRDRVEEVFVWERIAARVDDEYTALMAEGQLSR